jgi:hypothetical protein
MFMEFELLECREVAGGEGAGPMGDDEGVQVGKEGGARTNSELSVT